METSIEEMYVAYCNGIPIDKQMSYDDFYGKVRIMLNFQRISKLEEERDRLRAELEASKK